MFAILLPLYFTTSFICGTIALAVGLLTLSHIPRTLENYFGVTIAVCAIGWGLSEIGLSMTTAIWVFACQEYYTYGNFKAQWVLLGIEQVFEFHYWLFAIQYLYSGAKHYLTEKQGKIMMISLLALFVPYLVVMMSACFKLYITYPYFEKQGNVTTQQCI